MTLIFFLSSNVLIFFFNIIAANLSEVNFGLTCVAQRTEGRNDKVFDATKRP